MQTDTRCRTASLTGCLSASYERIASAIFRLLLHSLCSLILRFDFSLATDTEHVRAAQAAYANNLLSMGVVGLRFDAAKRGSTSTTLYLSSSIPPDMAFEDLSNVISRLSTKPYVTQEASFSHLARLVIIQLCCRSPPDRTRR